MQHIPVEDRGSDEEPKILGLKWNLARDTLRVTPVKRLDSESLLTKRRFLKALPQLFDSCGMVAPVTVTGKLMVQDLWARGLDWDDPVPSDVDQAWKSTVAPDLLASHLVEMPRLVKIFRHSLGQLHAFCDASQRVCAAAIYVRVHKPPGTAKTTLLMSKTRLSPIRQKLTIPCLELVAATLGARLLAFVDKHLGCTVSERFLWTDSQCVLHWIRRRENSSRFVQNRVRELFDHSGLLLRYPPTADNPADIPTRGCRLSTLRANLFWWKGPSWLNGPESSWPRMEVNHQNENDMAIETTACDGAERPSKGRFAHVVVQQPSPRIIDDNRFSSLQKLIRVTAFVLRFVHNCRLQDQSKQSGALTLTELSKAVAWWIRMIQAEYFPLLKNLEKGPSGNGLSQLTLFRDEHDIVRCRGRIDLADVDYETRHPALLPKNCYFSDLVVRDSHRKALHAGVAQTLAETRQRFWIIHGRSTVKRVLRDCRVCRKFDGGPFGVPEAPSLPRCRVEKSSPFTHTGVDYLGPLVVRSDEDGTQKVWLCLFTCAVTRAVHLELVADMSTSTFLLAFRRFVAAHGCPAILLSDNGTQFRATSTFLRRLLKNSADLVVREYLTAHNIEWHFTVELAPWMSGFYERLVGTVKQALRKSLNGVCATTVELQTVVAEIASVINSRPLTYVESDPSSLPITPSQLLSPMRRKSELPIIPVDIDPLYTERNQRIGQSLDRRWRRLEGMVTNFWRGWKSCYLLSLRERLVSHRQRGTAPWQPTVGTVVQLKENLPRATWRIGRLVSLHRSTDGKIRSASIRLSSDNTMRRPLSLVYPLELDESSTNDHGEDGNLEAAPDVPRASRSTAVSAKRLWQQQLSDEDEQ